MSVLPPPYNTLWESCDPMYDVSGTPYSIDRKRDYVRKHLVIVTRRSMGPIDVCLCPLLPKAGEFYTAPVLPGEPPDINLVLSYDTQAILTRQSAARRYPDEAGKWAHWVVTSEYTTFTGPQFSGDGVPGGSQNQPEKDLAEVSWDFETANVARPHDLRNFPFLTTGGMPYSPPFSEEVDYPVLTISRNELSFNYAKASAYARAVNDATFLGAPAGCVLVLPPRSNQKVIGNLRYARTTYKLKFRSLQQNGGYFIKIPRGGGFIDDVYNDVQETWTTRVRKSPADVRLPQLEVLDSWQPTLLMKGMYRLGTAAKNDPAGLLGRPIPIFKNGHPLHHPVMLDDEGQEVVIPANLTTDIPVFYRRHTTRRSVSIKALLVKGVT